MRNHSGLLLMPAEGIGTFVGCYAAALASLPCVVVVVNAVTAGHIGIDLF